MKFLSAHWRNLLLANYVVDPAILEEHVPKGTSIDLFKGQAFVSLVAFLFDKTRVLGIPVPFHRKFEEVNLRFYVAPDKDPSIRAVTFIKEIVPKRILSAVANSFFNENYSTEPMSHGIEDGNYWYAWGENQSNRFTAQVNRDLSFPDAGSIGEFITEHYWGYAQGKNKTIEYRVEHPQWQCCEVDDYEIEVDFEKTYGSKFGFLNSQQPQNVQFAAGSAVTVSFPGHL